MLRTMFSLVLVALAMAASVHAQSPAPGVPRLVPASGTLFDLAGQPLNGENIKITFSVYANAVDQVPLWSETLKVQVTGGHYDALIGSSSPDGIPSGVFAAGEARWLGITADKAMAPPRSLLVSVPYALSADDASKLGGHPASAFVLKDDPNASNSPETPSGWKQAVDEEATARKTADTTLQENVDGAKSELNLKIDSTKSELNDKIDTTKDELDNKIDAAKTELTSEIETKKGELDNKIETTKTELTGKIDGTKADLNTKIELTKEELDLKIDGTKSEFNAKILVETSKVASDQESKMLELKTEQQTKLAKDDYLLDKEQKDLDVAELKLTKLSKEEYLLEKEVKDADIGDLKLNKLDKVDYFAEKLVKEAEILDLREKKLEKLVFELEKQAKDAALKALDDSIKELKAHSDALSGFVATFSREPNGDTGDANACIGSQVATGIAVGLTADPLGTAAPQCAEVIGANVRADGSLIGVLSGVIDTPGLQQIPPASELACPAGHVAAGLQVEGGNLYAACKRLFSDEPIFNSQASVAIGDGQATQLCLAGQSLIGLRMVNGTLDIVCR